MNTLRRKLIFVGGLAAIPMSMGCLTAAALSGDSTHENYVETVNSVLVSADGKNLAVLGQEFHYLFAAPDVIKAVLQSDLRTVVAATFQGFAVDRDQKITGSYTLVLGKNVSAEQRERARAAGFTELPNGNLEYTGKLAGTRYAANGIQATDGAQKLRHTYSIHITAEKSAGAQAAATAGKILITPITLAADGVLILAAVPLLLIFAIGASAH